MSLVVIGTVLAKEETILPRKGALPITEDYIKAKEMAQAYQKPMGILFTGSDWCQYSRKLLDEVLFDKAFAEEVKKEFVFVNIDFPELNPHPSKRLLEQNYLLKEEFQVKSFPLLVLVDEGVHEITRLGFSAETSAEYGRHLVALLKRYREIKHAIDRKKGISFIELQERYFEARELGSSYLIEKILALGLKQDKEGFFHLESYSKAIGEERQELRRKILSLNKDNKHSIALRLAILDYQELQKKQSNRALEPLLEYAKSVGSEGNQEDWRVHMLISQHLALEGHVDEAIEHAEFSLKLAPEDHRNDIKRSIKLLSTELIAHQKAS